MAIKKASDISIQFYATPEELCNFIQRILDELAAYATLTENNPFQMQTINSSDLASKIDCSTTRRIYITLEKPVECSTKREFDENILSPLVLDVGVLDKSGLHQSWLACRVFDQRALTAWRRVAKELKEETEEGLVATNRDNGVSKYYRSFRHTIGARKLQEQGVEIIPMQGKKGPKVRLGKQIMGHRSGPSSGVPKG